MIIQTKFKANGFISSTKIEFLNKKASYYDFNKPSTGFRIFCEAIYVILLIYYLVVEAFQIYRKILSKLEQ